MNRSFQDLSALGLSLLAFAAAELVGGNGFIAAFCAGLALGNTSRAICERHHTTHGLCRVRARGERRGDGEVR